MPPKVSPLDREDPTVTTARAAEREAYAVYGLEPTDHRVQVPELGCTIRVVEVGSGPPLVLIAGGHGPGFVWLPLIPELEGYTAYVMDRPGGGLSDEIDYRSLRLREQAATSTRALFDHFQIEQAPILGNSMGGLWAMRFALAHADRAPKLALLGCPGFYPGMHVPFPMRLGSIPGLSGWIVRNMMQSDGPEDARATLEWMGHPPETTAALPEEFAETWYRMEQVPNFELAWTSQLQTGLDPWTKNPEVEFTERDLERIDAPVCLLWGSNDLFGSLETGRSGARYFRDAEFHEVGVGHLPWLDEPHECGELVRGFLQSNS